MVSTKSIVALAVALAIAATLLSPVANTVASNSGSQDVTNETVTAQYDTHVELTGYNIDSTSETVWGYNDSSGSYEQLVENTDYTMDYDGGSINVSSASTVVQDGEDVKVSYTYQATSGSTTTVVTLVPLMMALLMIGVIANKIQGAL